MSWRRSAPWLIAGSILVLMLAIYGHFGELSFAVAVCALALLLVGVGMLVVTHAREGLGLPHWGVLALAATAAAMHLYSARPSIGLGLWGTLPYALAVVLSSFRVTRHAAIGGALLALVFDAYLTCQITTSRSSTAVLGYVWMPVWSTLIFVPLGTAVTLRILRRRARADANAS